MDILRKFFFDGFIKGDYTYGSVHVWSIIIMLSLITISVVLLRGKEEEKVIKITKIVSVVALVIYFIRHLIDGYQSGAYIKSFWPFYICNINTIFLSIWILFDIKFMKDFFIITGMFGAVLMFVVPAGIFNDQYLTISILDSVMSHFTIVYIPIILLSTRVYELDIKRSWQVMLGFAIIIFNVEVLQRLLFNTKIDYLFLRGPLPFTIEGVPQFIIVVLSAIITVYITYFINYAACGKLPQLKEDLKLN